MVINLRSVLSEVENPLLFDYVEDMSDYELYGIKPFKSGVYVRGRIEKSPVLTLDMSISAKLDTLCASCGAEITKQLDVETHNLLVTHTKSDDDEYIVYSNDEVDISRIVSDALTLNMEMRPLCKEDCKGFCTGCGVNLNTAPCRCKNL